MKTELCSKILARTAEGMQAYRLSRQILAARDPARWGIKCSGGHEDMRTSFVWIYLNLKYGEGDSRKTVTGRICRISKKPSLVFLAASDLATSRHSTSQLELELIQHLGLPPDVANRPSRSSLGFVSSVCNVAYTVLPSFQEGAFNLVLHPQEPAAPCPPGPSIPVPPPFLSLFHASIEGSPFSGGTIDIFAPWLFVCDCDLRLLNKRNGKVLSEARVKLKCYGERYKRVTRCKVPLNLVEGLSVDDIGDMMVEQSLTLNLNSSFLLEAVNAVLPGVEPFSRMVITYVAAPDPLRLGRSHSPPSVCTPTPIARSGSAPPPYVATPGPLRPGYSHLPSDICAPLVARSGSAPSSSADHRSWTGIGRTGSLQTV